MCAVAWLFLRASPSHGSCPMHLSRSFALRICCRDIAGLRAYVLDARPSSSTATWSHIRDMELWSFASGISCRSIFVSESDARLTRRSTRTSRMRGCAPAAGRRLACFVRPHAPSRRSHRRRLPSASAKRHSLLRCLGARRTTLSKHWSVEACGLVTLPSGCFIAMASLALLDAISLGASAWLLCEAIPTCGRFIAMPITVVLIPTAHAVSACDGWLPWRVLFAPEGGWSRSPSRIKTCLRVT